MFMGFVDFDENMAEKKIRLVWGNLDPYPSHRPGAKHRIAGKSERTMGPRLNEPSKIQTLSGISVSLLKKEPRKPRNQLASLSYRSGLP